MYGRRIQLWRRHGDLTQEEITDRTGLSLSSVQRAEAGGEVRFSTLILIADAVGVPIATLLAADPTG